VVPSGDDNVVGESVSVSVSAVVVVEVSVVIVVVVVVVVVEAAAVFDVGLLVLEVLFSAVTVCAITVQQHRQRKILKVLIFQSLIKNFSVKNILKIVCFVFSL
jgi:hypothetical protein